jgi:hypothetical protein
VADGGLPAPHGTQGRSSHTDPAVAYLNITGGHRQSEASWGVMLFVSLRVLYVLYVPVLVFICVLCVCCV